MTRKTVEANAVAYDNLDKAFTSLNGYYATRSSKGSNAEVDRLAQELNSTVNRLKRRNCMDRYFTYICIIFLTIGLVILSWNTFEIQYTYALRLLVVYVGFLTVTKSCFFFNCHVHFKMSFDLISYLRSLI